MLLVYNRYSHLQFIIDYTGEKMRAIIRCRSNVDPKGLDGLLIEKDWWPGIDQIDPEVVKRKDEILSHVAVEDLIITERTYLYTIYDEATKSWGIVNNPTKHGITFRIKNPDSDKLKAACERLVKNLQEISNEKRHGDGNIFFEFISFIEVLEPNSINHAYSGEILPPNRSNLAIQTKRSEFIVGIGAGILALFLLIVTMPPIENVITSGWSVEWYTYVKGFSDRLATSAIVTSTVSILTVLLYYFDIRRKSIIKWQFD
jgi:hypothetical protein